MSNSFAKKAAAVASVAAIALSSVPMTAFAAAHTAGTNVKSSDGTIWMIMPDNTRRAYTSAGAFLSFGFNSFSTVVDANADDLALTAGSFIAPQDGTIFCATETKGSDVKGECALVTGGMKASFVSADVFTGQGFSFTNAVYGDSSFMSKTSNVASASEAHRSGVLVNNGGTVQLVGGSGLLGIPDLATFNSWGYSFGKVVMANAADKAMTQTGVMAARTPGQLNPTALAGGTNPTPSTSGMVATLSSDTPASGVLSSGQALADLAHFTLTGNGTVTQLKLKRTGLSNSSTLSNVYLFDGNTRLSDGYSFNTNGELTITGLNLVVSGSKMVSVLADVYSSASTGTVGISLIGFQVAGVSTMDSANVTGNTHAVNAASGILGTANFTTASPSPAATSINAGSTNQTLWSNSLSIGTRAMTLNGFTVKMIGSAPSNTLSNTKLFVDGTEVASAAINTMNQYVFTPSTPTALSTGSHLIEVRADVIGGANRNFYLSLEKSADVMIKDPQVGLFVSATASAATLTNLLGGVITIQQGSLVINQDTSFNNTTTLVGGATNVKMAAFKFTAFGEDVKVMSLTFTPTFSGLTPAGTQLANVGLYVNGGQVGSSQTATTATPITFSNLGSNLIVSIGTPVTVEIKGDVMNTSSAAYTAGTVKFDLSVGSSNAQGVTSSQLFSTSAAGGQSLTIGNNVTFGATSGFSTSTKAPNSVGVKIGSFSIAAGSAEGLTVNNISVTLPSGAGNTMQPANQLTNLKVREAGSTTDIGTPIGNPVITTSNSFSTTTDVAQGTTKVFEVWADFGSGSSGLTVTPSMAITYRGKVSNLSATTSTAAGSTTTSGVAVIATTGVTFNTGLSSTSRAVVTKNNFEIGTFNFKVSNSVGGGVIKDVTFTVPANTVSTITMNGKTASVVGTSATIYNVGVTVPADSSGVNVPVTVALVCTGTANGCAANSPVTVNATISSVTYNDGSQVQTVVPASATTVSHYIYASVPTFSVDSVQKTGFTVGAENKIGEVTITADAAGQIKVNNIAFNVAASGLTAVVLSGARLADGNTTIPGSSISSGCTTTGACVMTLGTTPNGYTIAAGGSKTFSLYATVSGTVTASTVVTVSSSVTPATTTWDDSMGGGVNQPATNIFNFPTASYSIRQ